MKKCITFIIIGLLLASITISLILINNNKETKVLDVKAEISEEVDIVDDNVDNEIEEDAPSDNVVHNSDSEEKEIKNSDKKTNTSNTKKTNSNSSNNSKTNSSNNTTTNNSSTPNNNSSSNTGSSNSNNNTNNNSTPTTPSVKSDEELWNEFITSPITLMILESDGVDFYSSSEQDTEANKWINLGYRVETPHTCTELSTGTKCAYGLLVYLPKGVCNETTQEIKINWKNKNYIGIVAYAKSIGYSCEGYHD